MAGSPNIPQGFINRTDVSVLWLSYPLLTVTAPFLGKAGVSLAFDGDATTFIPTLTGNVVSQQPFQMFTLTLNLIRSQGLAQIYEAQRLTNSLLGNGTVFTDTSLLGPYSVQDAGIRDVNEIRMDGEDSSYVVVVRGTYPINSEMWS